MRARWILFLLLGTGLQAGPAVYDITGFGAKPNARAPQTEAIQKAIDTCHREGGGTVLVPAGQFVSGSLRLRSSVNLHLEPGAMIRGSLEIQDYEADGVRRGLIFAEHEANISITGYGVLHGCGTAFMNPDRPHISSDFDRKFTRQGEKYMTAGYGFEDGPVAYENRPGMMVVILKCENVLIENVTFSDSPSWTMRLGDSDNVRVRGITILNNMLIPNSDGIHCTTSRNVEISDCDIRAGDDGIIVTGFGDESTVHGKEYDIVSDYASRKMGNRTGYAENVTVSNCTITSRSSGIRVGYGDNSIRNCVFQNLVITNSNRGLGVFVRDAGSVENILFSNIVIETRLHSGHWWGNGEPIHVSAHPQKSGVKTGSIRNVRFVNILAEGEAGIVIYGEEESPVEDILLQDVRLGIRKGKLTESYGGNFDLRPSASLETAIFKHDIPGLFSRHVNGLTVEDFDLRWEEGMPGFFTDGIFCEHVRDLVIDGFTGRQAQDGAGAAVSLADVKGIAIRNSRALPGTKVFLEHRDIGGGMMVNNDLFEAETVMRPARAHFTLSINRMPLKKTR